MAGKKYRALQEKLPLGPVDVKTAVTWLKDNVKGKNDPTVEIHIRLGVDHEKSDQMVRGEVTLPGGSPKQKRIVVFTADKTLQAKATEAGAAAVGGKELVDEIVKNGSLDADTTIATPDMMPVIAKIARVLGPKGLMPNPKTGTVTPDPVKAMKELSGGKVFFKMDTLGNLHEAVAKLSWDAEKITKNIEAFFAAVSVLRPATMKGQLVKGAVVKTTMSPAVKINW